MSVSLDQRQENRAESVAGRNNDHRVDHRLTDQSGPGGWLAYRTADDAASDQDPLARHADWRGPSKLVGSSAQAQRLTELFVSPELFGNRSFDADARQQFVSLMDHLRDDICYAQSPDENRNWVPPDTELLVGWLASGGFQAAVGNDGNLRLTLKARGTDGQIVGHCDNDRLRFVMRLGAWTSLTEESEQAMLYLARQANDRSRLARIAWLADGTARSCQAQVDLTGLSTDGPAQLIWPDMLCMSMHAMELVLRRLGIELDLLADPANRDIAIRLIEQK